MGAAGASAMDGVRGIDARGGGEVVACESEATLVASASSVAIGSATASFVGAGSG